MYEVDLKGKNAVVFGVANHRSIAWAIAKTLNDAGARIAITYQNERLGKEVGKLAPSLNEPLLFQCDVANDKDVSATFQQLGKQMRTVDIVIHSIAFAHREDLGGDFSNTPRERFLEAIDISSYSLVSITREAAPLMEKNGGSIVAMTFQASERVFPGYNVMGTAKAALENEIRQLASEFGPKNIRINAISAGPLDTLAARGIHRFVDMKRSAAEKSPLQRNITHDEVAKTALYLCSDLSSGVTGANIPVDAGYSIMGI